MAKYNQDNFYDKEILPYLNNNKENNNIIKEKFIQANNIIAEDTQEKIGKEFKEKFSTEIFSLFKYLNIFVAIIIVIAFSFDQYFILNKLYDDISLRLVTPKVLMILIGATATQIAIAFSLLAKYVFKVFDKK